MFHPLLQTYKMVILFAVYFLYVYARPYKATFVNIIELALLAYLGIFLAVADGVHERTGGNIPLDATSIDSCGKPVPTISTEWIVFGVLYFLPVTVLLLLVGRWLLCSRGFQILRCVCIIIGDMPKHLYHTYIIIHVPQTVQNCIYIRTYIILCGGGHAVCWRIQLLPQHTYV